MEEKRIVIYLDSGEKIKCHLDSAKVEDLIDNLIKGNNMRIHNKDEKITTIVIASKVTHIKFDEEVATEECNDDFFIQVIQF